MTSTLLLLSLLQTTPATAPASPTRPINQPATPTTLAGRATQYHRDYLERLRAVFFASGDPRATFLLSTATEELSARRRALQAELKSTGKTPAVLAAPPAWQAELAELHKTPQAVKFLDRCRRNPALETAYQRFLDAGLDKLAPAESR